jgi:Tripartite tricarboxylate transporter family receptor
MSIAAGYHDSAVRRGWSGGYSRAHRRRADASAIGTVHCYRKRHRCGRNHWRRPRCPREAGWPHDLPRTTGTHVLNSALYSLPYDVLNDFLPISPLAMVPLVLYSKRTIPAKSLSELIGWVNVNKASAGTIAGNFRLMTMLFQRETSTNLALVPYRGGAPTVQDLAAGQIDVLIATSLYLPLRAGSVQAYAVTSDTREHRKFRLLRNWDCRRFPISTGTFFSLPRAHPATSSAD